MKLSVHIEDWVLKQPFRITGREWRTSAVIVVQISDGNNVGSGEGQGVYYLNETTDSMFAQVESIADDIRQGVSRESAASVWPRPRTA